MNCASCQEKSCVMCLQHSGRAFAPCKSLPRGCDRARRRLADCSAFQTLSVSHLPGAASGPNSVSSRSRRLPRRRTFLKPCSEADSADVTGRCRTPDEGQTDGRFPQFCPLEREAASIGQVILTPSKHLDQLVESVETTATPTVIAIGDADANYDESLVTRLQNSTRARTLVVDDAGHLFEHSGGTCSAQLRTSGRSLPLSKRHSLTDSSIGEE